MANLKACIACAAMLAAAPAWSEVVVNESPEINFVAYVSCANNGAGELVSLNGPLHTLITYTINGNRVSGKTHFQPKGLTGTGLTTGDIYHGVGVTQSEFSSSFVNGQSSQTYVNNFRIIGQGPGNNYMVHENFHLTINASGEVSSYHDNFSADCK